MIFLWIMMLLALLISGGAQAKIVTTYKTFFNIRNLKGVSGAQAARAMLNNNAMVDVRIELDHDNSRNYYDTKGVVIRLTSDVFNGESIASIGIAAHEVGHAIQDETNYKPLKIKTTIEPIAHICSSVCWFFVLVGLLFQIGGAGIIFIKLGIILFILGFIIQIIALPSELNASKMALELLNNGGYLSSNEYYSVKKVLDASSLMHIASALVGIFDLIKKIKSTKETE